MKREAHGAAAGTRPRSGGPSVPYSLFVKKSPFDLTTRLQGAAEQVSNMIGYNGDNDNQRAATKTANW